MPSVLWVNAIGSFEKSSDINIRLMEMELLDENREYYLTNTIFSSGTSFQLSNKKLWRTCLGTHQKRSGDMPGT